MDIDAPPSRKWLREKIELMPGVAQDPITVNCIIALVDAYARRRYDDGYEIGYSDGCNVCTTDHE